MASETNYQRYKRRMKGGGKKKPAEEAPKKAKRTSRRREGMEGVIPALGLGALDGASFSLADEVDRAWGGGAKSAEMEQAYEDQPIAYGAGKVVGSVLNPIALIGGLPTTARVSKDFKTARQAGDWATLPKARKSLDKTVGRFAGVMGLAQGAGGWAPGELDAGERLRDATVGGTLGYVGAKTAARAYDEAPTLFGKPRMSAPSVAYGPRGAKAFMDEGLAFDELALRQTGTQRPKMSRQARAKKADGYTTPSRLKDTMVKPVLARAAAQSGEPEIGRLGLEIDGVQTKRAAGTIDSELARIEAKARPVAPGTPDRKPQAIARVATEDPNMGVFPRTGDVPGNMMTEIDALPREQKALVAQLIIARSKGLPPPADSVEAMERLAAMGSDPMKNLMRALGLPVPRVRMKVLNPANPDEKVPVLPGNTPEAAQQRELEDTLTRLQGLARSGKDDQGELLPIDLERPWTRIGRDAPGGVAAGQRALNLSEGRLDESFAQEMLALRDQPIDVFDPKLPADPELPLLESRKIMGKGNPVTDAPPGFRTERVGGGVGALGEWGVHELTGSDWVQQLIEMLKGQKQGAGAAPAGASR